MGFNLLDSKATGINFNNTISSSPELNILNYLYFYNGAGVCVADFNNDNLPDIFFSGNQTQNQLYLNKGDLKFENITNSSQIPKNNWSTGVTSVDINQDGLMDIYVCQVTGLNDTKAYNQLLVNQGLNKKGIPTFKDEAKKYGLNISSYAQQAGFFDYDKDGDLDLFLLNHSLHPNRTYGNGNKRLEFHPLAGDKLFENQNSKFVEITSKSNIFSSEIGYGLDFSLSDINFDGFTDIYIGNDFFENDYLYINQNNKTFSEIIHQNQNALGHTTHFSMGNAIADINNDLKPDILSVDMLPENIKEYKVSGTEYPYLTYQQYLKNNYAPQYMSNTLHLNIGNLNFSEVANAKNIAATDWSWSALIADFNNDSNSDIFISNGILGATNDMDFINFISDKTYQNKINQGLKKEDLKLLDKLPKYKKQNKLFLNQNNKTFQDTFKDWDEQPASYSNGATFADLDNDGDLDIIVNNINDEAMLYENLSNANYLKIKPEGNKPNKNGIGAKVIVFVENKKMLRENFVNQGYMSSTRPEIHFGLGQNQIIDSAWVIWPNDQFQSLKNTNANQTLTVKQSDAKSKFDYTLLNSSNPIENISPQNIPFKHHEYQSYEFSRQPLIPYMNANLGPEISIADINKDGLDDIFVGNAKLKASRLFLQQNNGSFQPQQDNVFKTHEKNEDLDQAFIDVDNDGDLDLIVVSGGNEFQSGEPLQPRLYLNTDGQFSFQDRAFPQLNELFNSITKADVNQDGYVDIFLGAGIAYETFGLSPKSYLLINQKNNTFKDATLDYFSSHQLGMIRDAHFKDLNNNDIPELIIAGHFMPIQVFELKNNSFQKLNIKAFEKSNGLWNTIHFVDIDKDGFQDIIAGNFGTNTKLKASLNQPIKLHLNDFNLNGQTESLLSYFHQDKEVLFNTKDELAAQIPSINKRFRSYKAFAEAEIEDIFDQKFWMNADKKYVYTLETTFFKNLGDFNFKAIDLPQDVQYSSVNAALDTDLDQDDIPELILTGNRFNLNTQLGQLDANHGLILKYKNNSFSIWENHNLNLKGRINSAEVLQLKDEKWLIFGTNNDSLQIRRIIK
ncbi:VCBS repeat-containing protein [Mesohalobacter salilacus]|uniref:VCBS repeat-containing protein n=1 Tax=Mesohalobacter salilacus TaxID=2491711 RepID=UPI00403ED264